jgi:hypothetical protein
VKWQNNTIYTATLSIWLFQIVAAASPQVSKTENKNWPSESWEAIEHPMGVEEGPLRRQVEDEEHEFINRFNKLTEALRDFSETYNSGHIINVKKVKAVRKAWHELERSEWFKPYKHKGE